MGWGQHQLASSPTAASGDSQHGLQPWLLPSPPISLPFEGGRRVSCPSGCPQHPRGTLPPSPRMLCRDVKPAEPQHLTYSGTAPKSGTARASAAKILQYSRLEFWILHSWRCKQKSQGPVPSCINTSLGPPTWPGIPWYHCQLFRCPGGQRTSDEKALSSSTLLREKS